MHKQAILRYQRGNALFLILIAVALFAALAYAVTQSGKGSGNINKEQAVLDLSALANNSSVLSQAIARMKLVNGCTDDQISFEDAGSSSRTVDGTAYVYTNAATPADGSCKVFNKNGGGVTPFSDIPAYLVVDPAAVCGSCLHPQSWLVTASQVLGLGSDAAGTGTELVMWYGRLTKDQCININNKFGITNPAGNPPYDTFAGCDGPQFQGTYPSCADPIGDQATGLVGKTDFCFDWGGGAMGYVYMHVVLAR